MPYNSFCQAQLHLIWGLIKRFIQFKQTTTTQQSFSYPLPEEKCKCSVSLKALWRVTKTWFEHLLDPVGHFGTPWRQFGIFEAALYLLIEGVLK